MAIVALTVIQGSMYPVNNRHCTYDGVKIPKYIIFIFAELPLDVNFEAISILMFV